MNAWFEVSKDGLGKLVERQGKGRLVAELLQNALDENVTTVRLTLTPLPNRPLAQVVVEDDSPDGFKDLTHAYTLFAESYKKADPEKRGRYNLGEKLILAACRNAVIETTTGTVVFDEDGTRKVSTRRKRDRGSVFTATLRMNRAELDEAAAYLHTVLVPQGIVVTVNGQAIEPRRPWLTFEAALDTLVADDEGVLRPRVRKTSVELYDLKAGEIPTLYELGIPVVETGDRWHVNVHQKVPLNADRDNVRPAYLARLRTLVLNAAHDRLTSEDANAPWVQQATSSEDCSAEAIGTFLDLRFGKDRASYDPNDPEAGKRIVARGGTVLNSSMLNRHQWQNARDAGAIQAAGKLCPTPKPYSDDPDAPTARVIPSEQWTTGMKAVADYAAFLAKELMGIDLKVLMMDTPNSFLACYSPGELHFNLQRLGHRWFQLGVRVEVDELLIHEFGHQYSGDHLSEQYHEALCRLGARLKRLALDKPELLRRFMKTEEALAG